MFPVTDRCCTGAGGFLAVGSGAEAEAVSPGDGGRPWQLKQMHQIPGKRMWHVLDDDKWDCRVSCVESASLQIIQEILTNLADCQGQIAQRRAYTLRVPSLGEDPSFSPHTVPPTTRCAAGRLALYVSGAYSVTASWGGSKTRRRFGGLEWGVELRSTELAMTFCPLPAFHTILFPLLLIPPSSGERVERTVGDNLQEGISGIRRAGLTFPHPLRACPAATSSLRNVLCDGLEPRDIDSEPRRNMLSAKQDPMSSGGKKILFKSGSITICAGIILKE
ncbi:hypothetical protein C8R45DRAFT_940823 [Mycena sanguinolenta]|nr:hypothetical protein C8R45DRAFT_940823 [Mycena sanguinolenta]